MSIMFITFIVCIYYATYHLSIYVAILSQERITIGLAYIQSLDPCIYIYICYQ